MNELGIGAILVHADGLRMRDGKERIIIKRNVKLNLLKTGVVYGI